jgi:hypothetical protein
MQNQLQIEKLKEKIKGLAKNTELLMQLFLAHLQRKGLR